MITVISQGTACDPRKPPGVGPGEAQRGPLRLKVAAKVLFSEMVQTPPDQFISPRPLLRQQILRPDALPRLLVDHGKPHSMAGFSIHKPERRPCVSANRPFISDLSQCLYHKNDVPAF